MLTFLEAHGRAGRAEVLEWLKASFTGVIARDDWQIQRNLVHALRRVPRPADVSPDPEIEMLAALADPERPGPVVKEVINALSQIRADKAEQPLTRLLGRLEERLLQGAPPAAEAGGISSLIDRTVSGLIRIGTPNARRAVVAHGLKGEARLGDTVGRLAELTSFDLTADKTVVDKLTKALQDDLPRKVLGVVVRPKGNRAIGLVRALSGTRAAREILQQIVRDYASEDIGVEAGKALASPVAAAVPPSAPLASGSAHAPSPGLAAPGLSGDLEVFGLPNLLQSLAQSAVTGTLKLHGADKQQLGALALRKGRLLDANVAHLRGAEAVYQLLERPVAATFQFASRPDSELPAGAGAETLSLLFEGMRRYDELQRAAALVPDTAPLASTGMAPTSHPQESDQSIVTAVWTRARGGTPAIVCEREIPTDPYRIRRLLAFWVEQGSLKLG